MALKAMLLRNKIDSKRKIMEGMRSKEKEYTTREKELEDAVGEMDEETSDNDRKSIEDEVEKLISEKQEHENEIKKLDEEITKLEDELKNIEEKTPENKEENNERKDGKKSGMSNRKKFFGMSTQERSAFFADEGVRNFISRVREIGMETRAIKGSELTIPVPMLDLVRENIDKYSKLISRVRLRNVSGTARQNVMGTVPEGVWTEMCARLNELDFSFSQTEVDGYKVGGIIYLSKSTLEDSDENLAKEIIDALGQSIGIATDKSIVYGFGTKMPLGIAVRLAQTSEPENYPQKSRAWENLKASNMVTIPSNKNGLEFFKAIVEAAGNAKSKYSNSEKIWIMNEKTFTKIQIESMNYNSAGALIAVQDGKMPVTGGDIIKLSDDIIPDDNIIAGYGDLYLLAERAGSSIERSDHYLFADDMVAFKGTARYDGTPVIAEGFIAIGLGNAPVESAVFAGDKANDATLQELSIAGKALTPVFAPNKYNYDLTVTDAAVKVNAVANQANAKIEVTYNGKNVNNLSDVTVITGSKPMTFTIRNGLGNMVYTVNIKKS